LATYQALDILSLNAGVANTATTGPINTRSTRAETHKTYLASAALTAPDDWGFMAGSAFYVGIIDGFGGGTSDFTDFYAGVTLRTGVEGLSLGADYNYFDDMGGVTGTDAYTAALYASFKATEKLGLHLRGEYLNATSGAGGAKILAGTATLQYDLWENVLSRLEVRWDHDASGSPFRPFNGKRNDFLIAANMVYKF